jgi:hypothetical protein
LTQVLSNHKTGRRKMVPSLQISKTESSAPQMNPCLLERFPCGVAEERKVSKRSLQHQENTNLKMEICFHLLLKRRKLRATILFWYFFTHQVLLVPLLEAGQKFQFPITWETTFPNSSQKNSECLGFPSF